MSLEGQHLGEFEILERLGQGGMGAVYKARQKSLRRMVALKTLQASLADDADYIARFEQEAVAAAGLNHPNLVQVYSAGESEGLHWFAMEYVAGESAKMRLKRKGRLDPLEAVAIAIHVATALEYGWRKAALIHRDIKPDNIFLSEDGEVKLGDLGLAKSAGQTQGLTVTGHSMGTPHYISPEQVEAMKDVDLRADIYSLGCTLFHLLSGQPPFDGNSAVAIMMKHVSAPAPELRKMWPECPAELASVVGKMMRKQPAERQQNYGEVIGDLRRVYDVMSGASVPDTVASSPQTAARQKPSAVPQKRGVPVAAWVAGGAALLAAVAALIYFAPWKKSDAGGARAVVPKTSAEAIPVAQAPRLPGGEPSLADATKDKPFVNSLGMKFVPVPILGGPTGGQQMLFSVWDTRVQDYEVFAKETKRDWPKPDFEQGATHPAVNVSWEDAQAFCVWLTERERKAGKLGTSEAYRLPTDHEWSCAVGLAVAENAEDSPSEKGGKNGDFFPWGKQWPPPERAGNYGGLELRIAQAAGKYAFIKGTLAEYRDDFAATSPVGSFASNRFGLFDMGGNAWQWCEDWYDTNQKHRVLRGASWQSSDRENMAAACRAHDGAGTRQDFYGFRCVLAPVAGTPTAALEPGAIRLWDTPEKLAGRANTRWENGAMRLDGIGSPRVDLQGRDGILRARIRRNKDAAGTQLVLRAVDNGNFYRLTLQFTNAEVWAISEGKAKRLAQWPLPRQYGPDEWPLLEFEAFGDELSVSIDGQSLGSVHDSSITQPGSVSAFATSAGYFRDIVYVPLDSTPNGFAAAPATATKDAPFVNSLGMKFVPVPIVTGPTAGQRVLFGVWDTRVQDYAAYAGAKKVADSWTKQQRDGVPAGRELSHPVVGVSWEDAQAFCQWLTEKEMAEGQLPKGLEYRLPTDEEWSWAVGLPPELGTTPAEKSQKNSVDFPWGKDYPPTRKVGNYADETFHAKFPKDITDTKDQPWIKEYDDGYAATSPVGSFPANAYGLYDMGGNVWQWCEDWFDASHKERVLRGASWTDYDRYGLLSSYRHHGAPGGRFNVHGFRCVLAVSMGAAEQASTSLTPKAIVSQRATAAATAESSAEPWQDVLHDPHKLELSGGAEWAPEGLRLPTGAIAHLSASSSPGDGAIRVRATVGEARVDVSRWLGGGAKYQIRIETRGTAVEFDYFDGTKWNGLAKFPLRKPLVKGEPYMIELRTVGLVLSARINGEVVGSFTADAPITHTFTVGVSDANGPAVIKSIEVLDLGTPPNTQSPKTSNSGTPSSAKKDAPFVNTLGMKFVPVPIPGQARGPESLEGKVLFGVWDVRVMDYAAYAAANPKVDGAWKTQNRDGVPAGQESDHPVVGVNWDDAQGFCQWLTAAEQAEGKLPKEMKYRLPTDEEWSWAVGLPTELGSTPAEKSQKNTLDFPWGRHFPPPKKMGNYADESFHAKFPSKKNEKESRMDNQWIEGYDDGYATTSPAGTFPANAYGLCDMGGNVWQWCEDWFDVSHKGRVQRGASWNTSDSGALLSSYRNVNPPAHRYDNGGFRCVLGTSAR